MKNKTTKSLFYLFLLCSIASVYFSTVFAAAAFPVQDHHASPLVAYDQQLNDDLACPIHLAPFENPVVLMPCGHTFCHDCIEDWLRHHNTCPICRAQVPAIPHPYAPALLTRKIVDILNQKWIHPYNNWQITSTLPFNEGKGYFKDVFKGRDIATGTSIAIRKFSLPPELQREDLNNLIGIISSLAELHHPNILPVLGYAQPSPSSPEMLVGMDSFDTTLSHKLYAHGKHYNWGDQNSSRSALTRLHGIASGLAFLHSKNIVHGNLSSYSIVFSGEVVKLSDFAIKRWIKRINAGNATTNSESLIRWTAPEFLMGTGDNPIKSMDIYSLGMIMYEFLAKELPFGMNTTDTQVILSVVRKHEHPTVDPLILSSSTAARDLHELVLSCINFDSSQRPTALQVVNRLEEIIANIPR
ncbi:MAG: protein kinase [Oligoflexia bacterium]|nr:protein kinase [Oligoflexia bacterium]